MPVIDSSVTFERSAELDERQIRRYQIVVRLKTNSTADGPGTILQAIVARGIDIGVYYQEPNGYVDLGARCRSIKPKPQDDDPFVWLATCDFSSEPPERTATGERGYEPSQSGQGGNGENGGRPRDPQLRPPEYEWSHEVRRVLIRKADLVDDDGLVEPNVAVVNSAGFPFDPLPEIDEYLPVLTVSRNELLYSPTIALTYGNKINADVFYGFPPGSAKMAPPRAQRVYESGLWYWRVTYKIDFRVTEPYWDLDVLDAGYHALAADGTAFRIHDRDGNPTNEPWPLNGSGGAILLGGLLAVDPVFLRFRPIQYASVPFAPLGL